PIGPARVLGLLVLAGPVEAEGLRQLDVAAEVVVRGRGQEPARKVPLVEHEPLDERLAVEPEPPVASLDGAQAEVRFHPVAAVGDLDVVQARRAWMPWLDALERDAAK